MNDQDEIREAFKSIIEDSKATIRRAEHELAKMDRAKVITEAKAGGPWTDNIRPFPANNDGDAA